MKKIWSILYILIVASIICPLNSYAEIKAIQDNEDYTISSDYSFTPKFIPGVTKFETSESYNNAPHHGTTKFIMVYKKDGYNNYWAMYKNVGIWKKRIIDMKITLEDIVDTDTSNKCSAIGDLDDTDTGSFYFTSEGIGIQYSNQCLDAGAMGVFKVEFFDNETGKKISNIKSIITYSDIDSNESILLDNNSKQIIYYAPYGVEHLDLLQENFNDRYTFFKGNLNWTCTRTDGVKGSTGECVDNEMQEGTCYNNNCDGCYKAGVITTLNDGEFMFGWSGVGTGFSSPNLLRIQDSNPIKFVDKEKAKPGEEINYTIEQYVPNQSAEHYYKSWKITDNLENILKTSTDNISITRDENKDVTDRFDIKIENNILTVSAKLDYLSSAEFYNGTFSIKVKTKLNGDSKNIEKITNQAVLNVEYSNGTISGDLSSNNTTIIIEEDLLQVPDTAKFINKLIYIIGIILIISGVVIIFKIKSKK